MKRFDYFLSRKTFDPKKFCSRTEQMTEWLYKNPHTYQGNSMLNDGIKPQQLPTLIPYLIEKQQTGLPCLMHFCAWKYLHLSSGKATHLEIDILQMLFIFVLPFLIKKMCPALDRHPQEPPEIPNKVRFPSAASLIDSILFLQPSQ